MIHAHFSLRRATTGVGPAFTADARLPTDDTKYRSQLPDGGFAVSPQSDNVLFPQSRNVLLTPFMLGWWQKDNY